MTSRRRGASTRRSRRTPDCARSRESPAASGSRAPAATASRSSPTTEHVHIAFGAGDDATVRAFHAAALEAGHEDNGGPGERAVYHPGYYGAFVLDPDGHNVEVVNHNRP